MPRRFTICGLLFAFCPLPAIGLSGGSRPPLASADANDQPPNLKLERKNFTEKVTGFKTITDANTKTTTRIDMKSQFEMVYVTGGEVTVGSPESEEGRQSN